MAGVVEGISSQPFIDDEALQRIIKSSKKLRLLDVRGCNKVSDSSLVRIPAWDLEHIFLSGNVYYKFSLFNKIQMINKNK